MSLGCNQLTHLPLVPHICVSELGQDWFRQWLVACSAPSHYPNQCSLIVNWTLRNKLQWKSKRNSIISFKKIRLKMASAKWRPFYRGEDESNLSVHGCQWPQFHTQSHVRTWISCMKWNTITHLYDMKIIIRQDEFNWAYGVNSFHLKKFAHLHSICN